MRRASACQGACLRRGYGSADTVSATEHDNNTTTTEHDRSDLEFGCEQRIDWLIDELIDPTRPKHSNGIKRQPSRAWASQEGKNGSPSVTSCGNIQTQQRGLLFWFAFHGPARHILESKYAHKTHTHARTHTFISSDGRRCRPAETVAPVLYCRDCIDCMDGGLGGGSYVG